MTDPSTDDFFDQLVQRAADRYAGQSKTGWYFARSKLRIDPVYELVLAGDLLPSGGTLLDIGCGQGLMLALLVEAEEAVRDSRWPVMRELPPRFDRLVGIETRPAIAQMARAALGDKAEILQVDARTLKFEACSAALLFDVLHMMSREQQESLLTSLSAMLAPNGVILIRDADASAGWRFAFVNIGNRIKAFFLGRSHPSHYRSRDEWLSCFHRLGFQAELWPGGRRTPFGNVLFRVSKRTTPLP